MVKCVDCDEPVSAARRNLGYRVCLECGDKSARQARKRWTIAPMHKSNYVLVTNRTELLGLNNKGGLVRAE